MRKTKLLALVLVVAMIATMFVPSVAAAEDYTLSIVDKATGAATINANAGDTVDVYVTISNNPGVSCVAFNVSVPEGWSIKAAQNQKLFMGDAADQASSDNYTAGPNKDYFLWLMALGTQGDDFEGIAGGKLLTQNGNLVLIRYQIPEDAQTGAYTISVTPDLTNCFHTNVDSNGYIVPSNGKTNQVPGTESLTINVQGTEPEVPEGAACPEHPEVTTWTDVAENEWAAGGALTSGHYKLTGNQATTAALTVAEGENVCIDLNGYNITAGAKAAAAYYRVFEVNGALTVTDTAETDGVISGGYLKDTPAADVHVYGGNILVSGAAAELNLYGGVIADGAMGAGSYRHHIYGGNVGLTNGAVLNMHGGIIRDGKISMPQQATYYHGGGNIYASASTVNIYGGAVTGGDVTASYSSGSSANRKSYGVGGNIAVKDGTFYMEGGLVDNGNLYVKSNATCTTATPTSTAHAHGGNIYLNNTAATITGGVISNGTLSGEAVAKNGGTLGLQAYGGNMYIAGGNAEIKGTAQILDGEILNNKSAARGGNIYVGDGSVTTLSENAVISGGICNVDAARGGNVFIEGTFTMDGGSVMNGSAGWGSNIMGMVGAAFNLNDGTVAGGTGGSSVYMQRSTITVEGGSIANAEDNAALTVEGTETTNGGKAYINGGTVGDIASGRASEVHVTGGEIGVLKSVSAASTVEIGNGVVVGSDPSAYMVGEAVTVSEGKYTTAATVANALAAAKAGDTVLLVKDATATDVVVPADVTLDLNGNTLTANELAAALEGAQVKDSKGAAKLVVENMENVSFGESNNQLPVTTAEGCVFETVEFAENLSVENAQYKFYIKNQAAATMLDEAILNGYAVSIDVTVTWTEAEGNGRKVFTFTGDMLQEYAGKWDTKMFTLTFGDLTGITNLDCTASVTCNGVTVEA